jgi:glycosyltransferase involved in cell wall biosynthesis
LVRKERRVRLLFLGEGNLREELVHLADELGISEDIDLPGFVDNPFQYMARASLLALSSVFEGFGMVLAEALACGCPVVSTDCPGGPKEILDHGRYGTLVPVGDAKALAVAIAQALDNPQERTELIERGKEFSLDNATENYIRLIEGFCQA